VVLSYATPAANAPRNNRRDWMKIAVLILALVVPFVPFTFDTAPLTALLQIMNISGSEWIYVLLGSAFFMAIPLFAWRLRVMLQRAPHPPAERIAGWTIACVCMLIPIAMLTLFTQIARSEGFNLLAVVMIGGGMGILTLGVWQAIRFRGEASTGVDVLLSAAYLANAWVCLIGFYDNREIGYWLTLPVAALLLWDLIRRSLRPANGLGAIRA
jgi:hypothetical protein